MSPHLAVKSRVYDEHHTSSANRHAVEIVLFPRKRHYVAKITKYGFEGIQNSIDL